MTTPLKYSIIIPVYNEEAIIKKGVLTTIKSFLDSLNESYEVLMVDDGSLDNTVQLITENTSHWEELKVIKKEHSGKAFSLIRGAQEARGEFILLMDMDQATPISEFKKLIPSLDEGYDVVIGSRGSVRKNAPIGRKILSQCQIYLRNFVLGFKDFRDTQCGFKSYRRTSFLRILDNLYLFNPRNEKSISTPSVSAGFDVEVLFVAVKLGLKIKEIPVIWDYKMSRRVSLIRDAMRGIKEMILLKYLDLKGVYRNH